MLGRYDLVRSSCVAMLLGIGVLVPAITVSAAQDGAPAASFIDVLDRQAALARLEDRRLVEGIEDLVARISWPEPVAQRLNMPSRYLNGNQSVIDPRYQVIRDAFDAYMFGLSVTTDLFLRDGDLASGQMALDQLHRWAEAGSMEVGTTQQAQFSQIFYGHTFATSLDILLQHGGLTADGYAQAQANGDKIAAVKRWLRTMMTNNAAALKMTNNIGDWQGLTAMIVGLVADDQALVDLGIEKFKAITHKIGADNTFFEENGRAELALWYNEYSLIPVVLMAETIKSRPELFADGNPYSRTTASGQTVHDAAGFILDARDTPALMTRLTAGNKYLQKLTGPEMEHGGQYLSSWMELYHRRFPTPRFDDLMQLTDAVPTQSPFQFGLRNMALAGGDLDYERETSSERDGAPTGIDVNYFGMTIKKGVPGKADINPSFNFVDRTPTSSGVAIAEQGIDRPSGRPTVATRGLDYLVIDKQFAEDEKLFGPELNIRQFIGIGFDNVSPTVAGVGTAWLRSGQRVETWNTLLGYASGTVGQLTVTGEDAVWTSKGDLKVGSSGTAALNILDGGEVRSVDSYIGFGTPSVGSVLVSGEGALFENSRSLTIGNFGQGTLRVADGGRVAVLGDKWAIRVAPFAGSSGQLTIGGEVGSEGPAEAQAPGEVAASRVQLGGLTEQARQLSYGDGEAQLNFNHTSEDYQFDAAIVGRGVLNAYAGTTTLTADSDFVGRALVHSGASLIAEGPNVLSQNAIYAVQDGGALSVTGDQEIAGLLLEGDLHFAGPPGASLTVSGDYFASGGVIHLSGVLGDDQSPSDKLRIGGSAAGETLLKFNNLGGTGGPTLNGIVVVDIAGDSSAQFKLVGDFFDDAGPVLIAGAYSYALHSGRRGDGSTFWALRSQTEEEPDVRESDLVEEAGLWGEQAEAAGFADTASKAPRAPTPYSSSSQSLAQPRFQPAVPLFEALPHTLLNTLDLGTYQQRRTAISNGRLREDGLWTVIHGARSVDSLAASATKARVEQNRWGVSLGADSTVELENAQLGLGVSASYTRSSAEISSVHGNGAIGTDGFGFGGTLTWRDHSGFYIDTQGQVRWTQSDISSRELGKIESALQGFAYGVSIEAGYAYQLTSAFSLVPQVQLTHRSGAFSDIEQKLVGGTVLTQLEDGSLTELRVGLGFEYVPDLVDQQQIKTRIYGNFDIYQALDAGTSVNIGGSTIASAGASTSVGVRLGGEIALAQSGTTIFGEAAYRTGLGGGGQNDDFSGRLGLKVRW